MKSIKFYMGIILVVIVFMTGVASAGFYYKETITDTETIRFTKKFEDDKNGYWFIDTLPGNSEFGVETNLISYYHSIEGIEPPLLPDGCIKKARLKIYLRSSSNEDITLTVDGYEIDNINSRHFIVKVISDDSCDDKSGSYSSDDDICNEDYEDDEDDDKSDDKCINVMDTPLNDGKIEIVLSNPNETFVVYKSILDICYTPSISLDNNETANNLPLDYSLKSNFPNPFNPSTTIEYSLPSRADVVITVYNLLGQEIKKLVNESMPAGQHLVVWDGTDNTGNAVSTGIYFYRINTDSFSESKKMILLK